MRILVFYEVILYVNTGVLWGNIVREYWFVMREYCRRILVWYKGIL